MVTSCYILSILVTLTIVHGGPLVSFLNHNTNSQLAFVGNPGQPLHRVIPKSPPNMHKYQPIQPKISATGAHGTLQSFLLSHGQYEDENGVYHPFVNTKVDAATYAKENGVSQKNIVYNSPAKVHRTFLKYIADNENYIENPDKGWHNYIQLERKEVEEWMQNGFPSAFSNGNYAFVVLSSFPDKMRLIKLSMGKELPGHSASVMIDEKEFEQLMRKELHIKYAGIFGIKDRKAQFWSNSSEFCPLLYYYKVFANYWGLNDIMFLGYDEEHMFCSDTEQDTKASDTGFGSNDNVYIMVIGCMLTVLCLSCFGGMIIGVGIGLYNRLQSKITHG